MKKSNFRLGSHRLLYLKAKLLSIPSRLMVVWYMLTFRSYFVVLCTSENESISYADVTSHNLSVPLMVIRGLDHAIKGLVADVEENVPVAFVIRELKNTSLGAKEQAELIERIYKEEEND